MHELYTINVAKSEFREGFDLGDTSRILAIADPDLVNFSARARRMKFRAVRKLKRLEVEVQRVASSKEELSCIALCRVR